LILAALGCTRQQTPQSLIEDGIYQQLAVTWFEPPHRDISIALTAKKLGAEQVKGMKIARLSAEIRRLGSRVSRGTRQADKVRMGSLQTRRLDGVLAGCLQKRSLDGVWAGRFGD
jgi:hypothetical protein